VCDTLPANVQDMPYPSHLLKGEAVHWLLGQDAVGLAQPFPLLANSFMILLFGCVEDPVDPGFEVSGSSCEKVLIRINADVYTMPKATSSVI
jgi:hypothetical protein